jgi:apolipoprotein N-acyltransferase
VAVALAATEAARGVVLTGFPWVQPGHLWLDQPAVHLAAWVGPNGLGLLALALAAGLASWRPAGMAAALAGGAAAVGVGAWLGAQPVPAPQGAVVRVVQPNAAQHLKWDPVMAEAFFDRLLTSTAAAPRPDLVVWPETAVQFLLNRPGAGLDIVAEAAAGVPLVLGIQRTEGWRGFNALALMDAEGQVASVYDKHHLVPFGEYIPLGDLAADLFGITAFAAQEGFGYSAGPGPVLLDLGALGRAAPLICYEAVFPGILHALPARPDWLLQITNDGWFGQRSGPFQHLSLARLRAIEQGLPLVRAANTGVSAVFDARGRTVASLALGAEGLVDAPLPAALPPTPYARWDEAAFLILLALAALPLAFGRSRGGPRPGIDPAGAAT